MTTRLSVILFLSLTLLSTKAWANLPPHFDAILQTSQANVDKIATSDSWHDTRPRQWRAQRTCACGILDCMSSFKITYMDGKRKMTWTHSKGPRIVKKGSNTPHVEALELIAKKMVTNLRKLATKDYRCALVDITWTVQRPFAPGYIDSTHLFHVSFRVGATKKSWLVDTAKRIVSPLSLP